MLAAARARKEGMSREEIVAKAAKVRRRLVQIVAMDSLEQMQTGGRIGDAAKWVGTLLNVKPVVAINHQSGKVEPVGLARSHRAMLRILYSKFFKEVGKTKGLHIAVLHGSAPEEAQKLADQIANEYNPVELIINMTGPVLGVNTGPGALALCGYDEG